MVNSKLESFDCEYRDGLSSRTFFSRLDCYIDKAVICVTSELNDDMQSNDASVESNSIEEFIDITPSDIVKITYVNDNSTIISFGAFPHKSIKVKSLTFQNIVKKNYVKSSAIDTFINFVSRNKKTVFATIIASAIVLILSYFILVPLCADIVAFNLSLDQEKVLGETIFNSIKTNNEVLAEKSSLIQEFFDKSRITDNKIKVIVISDKEETVNAYAILGGYIVVYDKLLLKMESPEQLEALLVHEYTHLDKKHTSRQLFRLMASSLIISLLSSDFSGVSSSVLQNADALQRLNYSRQFEAEADSEAISFLKKNNYSVKGMTSLMELLESSTKEKFRLNIPFLSTHPSISERIKNAKAAETETFISFNTELSDLFFILKE